MTSELRIRTATEADRAAVLRFCTKMGRNGDYIGDVWDDWFADPQSDLLVGVLGNDPVALVHVSVADASGWLEGLRVAPSVRGRGVAHAVVRGAIAAVRARGATVLRLVSNRANTAMTHLLPQHGFELCFSAAWYSATARPDDRVHMMPVRDVTAALHALHDAPLLHETGGLYADGWSFVPWTAARLDNHHERSELIEVLNAGYAVVMTDGESEQPAVALLAGDAERVLAALRAHPAARAYGSLALFLPADGSLAQVAQRAGFAPRPNRFGVWALAL